MDQEQYRLMQVIEKVGVFRGFEVTEVQRLLRIWCLQTYEPNQLIYIAGEPSEGMLILLKGQLIATSKSGDVLGQILAGAVTGEMGVFTGRARSANVIASVESTGLVVRKRDLDDLLRENWKTHVKVLQNLMNMVCQRLVDANIQLESYSRTIQSMREEKEAHPRGEEAEEGAEEMQQA